MTAIFNSVLECIGLGRAGKWGCREGGTEDAVWMGVERYGADGDRKLRLATATKCQVKFGRASALPAWTGVSSPPSLGD